MLLLLILVLLVVTLGGGYYGHSQWGVGGGLGVVGTILVVVLILYLIGGIR